MKKLLIKIVYKDKIINPKEFFLKSIIVGAIKNQNFPMVKFLVEHGFSAKEISNFYDFQKLLYNSSQEIKEYFEKMGILTDSFSEEDQYEFDYF